ncbi:hypothetical protein D5086_031667 [Populus alba]|uniref:Uncharacterized protein n=1 Tax=Populus alba TaxID=43335 RepID=A0ACC4AJ82_POPAL
MDLSVNPMSKQRAFSFEVVSATGNFNKHQDMTRNATTMAESGGLVNNTPLDHNSLMEYSGCSIGIESEDILDFLYITRASDMVPNLDLILLASLYGCFIACVVGAIIFAILNALLLAFSLTLFSIAIIDLQDLFSFVSRFAVSLKENLELGFALLVCTAMYYAIGAMMASKPVFERMVSEFKVKARHVLSHLEVLATSC